MEFPHTSIVNGVARFSRLAHQVLPAKVLIPFCSESDKGTHIPGNLPFGGHRHRDGDSPAEIAARAEFAKRG
jgi:hypothetical protein